jgi:hypothetical protein
VLLVYWYGKFPRADCTINLNTFSATNQRAIRNARD